MALRSSFMSPNGIPKEMDLCSIIDTKVTQMNSFLQAGCHALEVFGKGVVRFSYRCSSLEVEAAIFCVDITNADGLRQLANEKSRLERHIRVYVYYTSSYAAANYDQLPDILLRIRDAKTTLCKLEDFQNNITRILEETCLTLAERPIPKVVEVTAAATVLPAKEVEVIPAYISLQGAELGEHPTFYVPISKYNMAIALMGIILEPSSHSYAVCFNYNHLDLNGIQAHILCLNANRAYQATELQAILSRSTHPIFLLLIADSADATDSPLLTDFRANAAVKYTLVSTSDGLQLFNALKTIMTAVIPNTFRSVGGPIHRDPTTNKWIFRRINSKGTIVESSLTNKHAHGDSMVFDDCYTKELIQRIVSLMPNYKGSRSRIYARFYFGAQITLRYGKTGDFVVGAYDKLCFYAIYLRDILQHTTYSTETRTHQFSGHLLGLNPTISTRIDSLLRLIFQDYSQDYAPHLFLSHLNQRFAQ